MHPITQIYLKTCTAFGLATIERDEVMEGFSVLLGKHTYHFRGGFTPFNNVASSSLGMNKYSTNKILEAQGIPVPRATAVTLEEYQQNKFNFDDISYPVVAKPSWDSHCGNHVTCNIQNKEALLKYIEKHIKRRKCISIEAYEGGLRSFRVLVFYNKVIGVVERTPARVIGDGEHSIRELIEIQNIIRKKLKKTIPTGPIHLADETDFIFKELGVTIDTIPEKDQIIPIRYICNATHGGTIKSLPTNVICKENSELAIEAARALNLNLVGFDVICEDISTPISLSRGYFIEANVDPDITIHENSVEGIQNKVSKVIIRKLIFRHPLAYLYALLAK